MASYGLALKLLKDFGFILAMKRHVNQSKVESNEERELGKNAMDTQI